MSLLFGTGIMSRNHYPSMSDSDLFLRMMIMTKATSMPKCWHCTMLMLNPLDRNVHESMIKRRLHGVGVAWLFAVYSQSLHNAETLINRNIKIDTCTHESILYVFLASTVAVEWLDSDEENLKGA